MAVRKRFAGDPTQLPQLLAAHITSPTCVENCADRKHAQKRIVKHADLFLDLRALWPKLYFCQSTMTDALLEVLKDRVDWDLRPEEANDWATTVAGRVRAMCRRLTQAEIKSPRAPWLRRFGATPPKGDSMVTSSANDCVASNDSCTPTSTEAGENAQDAHVIVVRDSSDMLATQRDTDTCETQQPQRRQTLESGASFCEEWDDEAGSAVRYRLSLDGKHREQQTWSKDLQVHLCCFFVCATTDRTSNTHAFREEFCCSPNQSRSSV